MRGTRVVEDPKTGIRILISRPAQKRIGEGNVAGFVRCLKVFLEILEAKSAYVSKAGAALEISIIGTPLKIRPWKLKP